MPASIEQTQRTIDLDPNWYYAHQDMALLCLKQGRNADAVSEAVKSVEMSNRETFPLGVLGFVYAHTGKRAEAQAILGELKTRYEQRKANGHDIARIYVGLGDKDQASPGWKRTFRLECRLCRPGWQRHLWTRCTMTQDIKTSRDG